MYLVLFCIVITSFQNSIIIESAPHGTRVIDVTDVMECNQLLGETGEIT